MRMTRHLALAALAAAVLGPVAAAQSPPAGKLKLDQFFDMESVSNPQLSPTATRSSTRGGDRQAQRPLGVVALDHERRRHRSRFLTEGSSADLVAGRHAHRVHAQRASHAARRSSCGGWTPKARPRRSRVSTQIAGRHRVDARRQVDRLHDARADADVVADQDAGRGPRARRGPRRRGSSRGSTTGGPAGLHRPSLHAHLHRPGRRRHAAPDHATASTTTRARSRFTPDGKEVVFSATATRTATARSAQYRAVRHLRARRRDRRGAAAHHAQRARHESRRLARRQLVAYIGYDYTTDTCIDYELYVMNIDGSGTRH